MSYVGCANDNIKQVVRAKYDAIACGEIDSGYYMAEDAYEGVAGYEQSADLQLGCGLPFEFTAIQRGEYVLDLGSGAGLDAFIASKYTGSSGYVLGLDISPAMINRARANAQSIGVSNVEFHLGDIEAMPFEDASIDVVISNCTLNLVPDKAAAFAEIHRVLRPGGRFVIADVVKNGDIDDVILMETEAYAGCAMKYEQYLDLIKQTGFARVTSRSVKALDLPQGSDILFSIVVSGDRSHLKHEHTGV